MPALPEVWTDYGPPAYGALRAAVAAAKRSDPLAPVTVLVPSNLCGVLVQRALAHGFGARRGVAGLEVLTVDRLADRLAAPVLVGSGRRPSTEPVLAAAWRRALAGEPGAFAPVAGHPSTVRALVAAHRELREVDEAGLDALRAGGPVTADLVRLHRQVTARLQADWYDPVDLRRVAATAGRAEPGTVIQFLPQDLPASAGSLLASIGGLTVIHGIERSGTPTAVLHASDADDEVRCVLRRLTATLRSTPAHRVAVLFGTRRPYARLLAEHLSTAGIRWNGNSVRPTIERTLARLLPEVMATHQTSWQRADVMRLLAAAPVVRNSARWERISRSAGVIGGDDWEDRLKAYAAERRTRSVSEAEAADEFRAFVTDLQTRLREGESLTTWPALADWGRATYTALAGEPDDRLPGDEIRAGGAVLRTLEALSGLATVEPAADLTLLALTLDLELAGDRPRHGRTGDGVLVGPLSAAIGLDADVVFVLGLSEDLVPGRPRTDALLPDEIRDLAGGQLTSARDRIEQRRRHVWAAFASAPSVTASYSRGDLRRSSARRPSRWLPEDLAGAAESRSFADSLLTGTDLTGEHEWRIRAAAAHVLEHDPVTELGVHLRRERDSDRLTRFDGDLSAHRVPDPADGTVVSPTALEAWSRCPHGYFMEKLLHVRPITTPEQELTISPIERGNLYHRTLDRFFAEQQAAGAVPGGGTPWSAAQRAGLRRIAVEVADDLTVRGATGHRLLWAQELAGILTRLDQFLDADQSLRAATGRRQVRSELSFGMHGEPPVAVPLPGGRHLVLKGSADRIDVGPDGIVVVDYKSGGAAPFAGLGVDDPTLGGAKLQLPAYGYAARLALGSADVSAEYWFLHRDAGRRVELPLTPAVEDTFRSALATIADGMAGGLFPHRPPEDDGWGDRVPCAYCDPDGLGTGEHRDRWARKRADPRLAAYVALVEPA